MAQEDDYTSMVVSLLGDTMSGQAIPVQEENIYLDISSFTGRDRAFSWDFDMETGNALIVKSKDEQGAILTPRGKKRPHPGKGKPGRPPSVPKVVKPEVPSPTDNLLDEAYTVVGRDRSLSIEILEQLTKKKSSVIDSLATNGSSYLLDGINDGFRMENGDKNSDVSDIDSYGSLDSQHLDNNSDENLGPQAISPLQKSMSSTDQLGDHCSNNIDNNIAVLSYYSAPPGTNPYLIGHGVPGMIVPGANDAETRVGAYTKEQRKVLIANFRAKRQRRVWRKQIKYDCRKKLADTRPRVKGRFVSRDSPEDGEPILETKEIEGITVQVVKTENATTTANAQP